LFVAIPLQVLATSACSRRLAKKKIVRTDSNSDPRSPSAVRGRSVSSPRPFIVRTSSPEARQSHSAARRQKHRAFALDIAVDTSTRESCPAGPVSAVLVLCSRAFSRIAIASGARYLTLYSTGKVAAQFQLGHARRCAHCWFEFVRWTSIWAWRMPVPTRYQVFDD
jgi:hypothetical protein